MQFDILVLNYSNRKKTEQILAEIVLETKKILKLFSKFF